METPISSPNTHLFSTSCQIAIRIVAGATSIAAAGLLFNSHQSEVLFGTNVDARYTYTPALKYYTIMNVVACACSLLSLLPVFILGRKFSNPANFFLLFLHDLMIAIFLAAGCGAATTIAQVGKHGNSHAGWIPICFRFEPHKRLYPLDPQEGATPLALLAMLWKIDDEGSMVKLMLIRMSPSPLFLYELNGRWWGAVVIAGYGSNFNPDHLLDYNTQ
ncbi:hypothetical protein R6Q59_028891 [Mikania micrantha]